MPAPDVSLRDAVTKYLRNRESFYEVLLPRLPDEKFRARFRTDMAPIAPDIELIESILKLSDSDHPLLNALKLNDLLKKPGYGTALGKTTISVDEAVARAYEIEETGVILFSTLVESMGASDFTLANELAERRRVLANLLQLDDELRYHRLRMTLSA